MTGRRSALTWFGGMALLALGFQKGRSIIGPYVIDPPLVQIHLTPLPLPVVNFDDEYVSAKTLANFNGKHVLVNIWAKWCPPCQEEIPSLDRLREKLGPNADLQVVAISVDPISFEQIRAFYAVIGIKSLAVYRGDESEIMQGFGIVGLPTSLLVDHNGHEIGRMIGPTLWDAPRVSAQSTNITANASATITG